MFTDAIREGRRRAPVFVGRPRADGNLSAAARLAARFGATLVPANCLRGDGARFRVIFEAPLRADPEAEVRRLAEALNARLLAWALAWPGQLSMPHARAWRSARLHDFRPVRPAPSACERARAG